MITKYTIDASGRTIGRVSSEAAVLLMGKNTPAFERKSAPEVSVEVVNVAKSKIPAKKLLQKEYFTYSGYPGGRKGLSMAKVIDKFGHREILKKAVYGMLPKNKLRKEMMKNLKIVD